MSLPLAYLTEEQTYWIIVPFVVVGLPLLVLLAYVFKDFVKAAGAVLVLALGVLGLVAVVIGWIVGSPDAKFIAATRELNTMLTTTGNTDSEVLRACTAVQDEYKAVDASKLSPEKAAAMKGVADAAMLWQLQLTAMKIDALSTSLGHDRSRDAGLDLDVARMTLPSIRSTIQDYLSKYD
jgi:hypothetical protein